MPRHTNREADTERLGRLYDQYAEPIYRYCFFRVFQKERAEELMQETFLKIWQYMKDGRAITNEKALLYTIATHLVIDDKRKRKEASLDALLEDEAIREPAKAGAEGELTSRAMLREVREELAKLSGEEQQLFTMRYVNDLDPKEIAEALGTTANVISVRLNRIMHKLNNQLGAL